MKQCNLGKADYMATRNRLGTGLVVFVKDVAYMLDDPKNIKAKRIEELTDAFIRLIGDACYCHTVEGITPDTCERWRKEGYTAQEQRKEHEE